MLVRQPYLPRFMAGGSGNPLGARAMNLGETEFRIQGTNKPDTIGKRVSSGCVRLTNEDVVALYEVKVGAKVIVLPATAARRPSQGVPPDAAFRLPDPALPSHRPSATNAQMLSSGPRIAESANSVLRPQSATIGSPLLRQLLADCVEKVLLRSWPKILRTDAFLSLRRRDHMTYRKSDRLPSTAVSKGLAIRLSPHTRSRAVQTAARPRDPAKGSNCMSTMLSTG